MLLTQSKGTDDAYNVAKMMDVFLEMLVITGGVISTTWPGLASLSYRHSTKLLTTKVQSQLKLVATAVPLARSLRGSSSGEYSQRVPM